MKNIFVLSFVLFVNTILGQAISSDSYLNEFDGNSVHSNGQNWTQNGVWGASSISYSQNNQLNINFNQSAWIFAENELTSTIDVSANKMVEVNASFTSTGKFLLIQLLDINNRSTGTPAQAVFPLSTSSNVFNVDFGQLPSNVDFSQINGNWNWEQLHYYFRRCFWKI